MIIDCHGHYTTTPAGVGEWREAQKAELAKDPSYVGSKGAMRALEALRNMAKEDHKNVTLKWDGSPALIFGRDENV